MQNESVEKVLLSGRVLTMNPRREIHEAVAYGQGRIVAVGSNAEVMARVGTNPDMLDLRGRAVVPGLIDAHAHLDREGLKHLLPGFHGARRLSDILDIISGLVARVSPGEWIVTMPLGEAPFYDDPVPSLLERRLPLRRELDRVAPRNPVYIRPAWGWWHGRPPLVSVANSIALDVMSERAPIDNFHPLIIFERDQTGALTGRIIEQTFMPVVELTHLPADTRFTSQQRRQALARSMQHYNAMGTTGIFEGHGISADVFSVYRDLDSNDALTVRAHLVHSVPWNQMGAPRLEKLDDFDRRDRHEISSCLKVEGYAVQLGTEELDKIRARVHPYTGWAGFYYDGGLETDALDGLLRELAAAQCRPVSLGVNVLPLFKKIARDESLVGRRWVVGHVGALTPQDVEDLRSIDACVTTHTNRFIFRQGCDFAGTPCGTAAGRRGMPPRPATDLVPLRSLVDAGVPVGLGSDNTPISMFYPIWEAVARRCARCGTPIGAEQALTRMEALYAATMGGAFVCGDEQNRGSIEVGKLADLAVLSADPLLVAEDSIPDIVSDLTIVGGNTVHRRHVKADRFSVELQ